MCVCMCVRELDDHALAFAQRLATDTFGSMHKSYRGGGLDGFY